MTEEVTKPKRKKKTKIDKIIEKFEKKLETVEREAEAEMASIRSTIELLKEENGLK